MSVELKKRIEETDWAGLLQVGFGQIAQKPELFKADASGATGIYLVAAGVAKLLREHLAAVTFREELKPWMEGVVKIHRENAEQLAAVHKRLDEFKSELDQLDKGVPLPLVRAGVQKDKFAPAGELTESDTNALRSVAAKTESVADRRIIENAAALMDMKRTLAARDEKQ
jgi:hypothetical protein